MLRRSDPPRPERLEDRHCPQKWGNSTQIPFVTTWKTTVPDESIFIPTAPGVAYDFMIDWGDGTVEQVSGINPSPMHTYTEPGTHIIAIEGDFPRLFLNAHEGNGDQGNAKKLQSVEQWGTIQWQSMERAFVGAENLSFRAKDSPDLSNVSGMSWMYKVDRPFRQEVGRWEAAQNAFVTAWKASSVIFIPTAPGYKYDFTIDWGDGTVEQVSGINPNPKHTYAQPGTYIVAIEGDFPRLFLNVPDDSADRNNAERLQTVEQWGKIEWKSMHRAFAGAPKLHIKTDDVPDLSSVESMSQMFLGISFGSSFRSFNPPISDSPIGNWDVSNVKDMSQMFKRSNFNHPIGKWEVSNVMDMREMFRSADSFNQPIGEWEVSNVMDMREMFRSADSFNQPIGDWKVSNVRDMRGMFKRTSLFNQPIGEWDVSNVSDMREMFSGAESFNQSIGRWDVSNVRDMSFMFSGGYRSKLYTTQGPIFPGAESFNQPIGEWDVSNVTDMREMFRDAKSFNQPIEAWDVSNVSDMREMFSGAKSFNQHIGDWDVSNVSDVRGMFGMFRAARSFNQPIGAWDVSNVSDMREMFSGAKSFNQPIGAWDVSKVSDMREMFCYADSFNQPIGGWNVSKVRDMRRMFCGADSFNQDISDWNVSRVEKMLSMFYRAASFNPEYAPEGARVW
jgi:surface protein